MKIITWNINGYRSIVGQNPSKRYSTITKENKLFDYIDSEKPDIVCLQETKATPEQIDVDKIKPVGYLAYYNSATNKKGYSGVATFTKIKPKKIEYGLGNEKFDIEGRVIRTDYDDFILYNIYFPKGYEDSERLDFKLEFYDYLFDVLKELKKNQKNIIISGDFNTAHNEIDLARPKENINTSGFMPIERKKIDQLIELGFMDSFRLFCKEPNHYTWWSQRGRARENNIGWRIDYHFVSKELVNKITNVYQQPTVYGSDHCPVVIEINLS